MPRAQIIEGEYYHIYNRGVEKRDIFLNDEDRWRFLTLLIASQGTISFPQVNRLIPFVKHWRFDNEDFQEILVTKQLELVCFCLMPNHFHLLLYETQEGGISKFMQRVSDAYTKYFNTKYNRAGCLFGSKFQSVHIDQNEYLNYLSAYIHTNPRELKKWQHDPSLYPWSSLQDFVAHNRFSKFLTPKIILEQFKNSKEYKEFVLEMPSKKQDNPSPYLIDY